MQQFLAHFRKQPRERLEYTIDYNPWLQDGETISTAVAEVQPSTDDMLQVTNIYAGTDGTIKFYVEGGLTGIQYQVTILATTSIAQTVEREIFWSVEEV